MDEVTYQDYADGLEERLKDLMERLKHKRYRAQLVRRVMTTKGKGREGHWRTAPRQRFRGLF